MSWTTAAKKQLKKLLSWQSIIVLFVGGGIALQRYDSSVAKKAETQPQFEKAFSSQEELARELLKLSGRVDGVEANIKDIKVDVRDIRLSFGAQLLEIAKATGARQTIPDPPAAASPTTP